MNGILVYGASGPLLLLSSFPALDDQQLLAQLAAKGLDKFLAWEVPLERCHDLYGYSYRDDAEDLESHRGIHVLDTDGHRIFLNFSLRELSGGIACENNQAWRLA